MFSEQQIKYFARLGETLNFSRTAESFNVSRQAISKGIAAMEAYYGLPLFIRDKKKVYLSEAGKILHEFYIEELERHSLVKKQLSLLKDKPSDLITIGFQDYISFNAGINNLLCTSNMDRIKVNIVVKQFSPFVLLNSLLSELLDIIIICKRFINKCDKFEMTELQRLPLMLLVSSRHPNVQPGATYKDFIDEPLIADRFEGEHTNEFNNRIQKEIELCGLNPSHIIEVPNKDSAYMAVKMDRGILICSSANKFVNSLGLQAYHTEADDTLLCLWREKDTNTTISEYVNYLKNISNPKNKDDEV